MGQVVCAHRVGIEVNTAEVDRPDQTTGVVDHRFFGRRPGCVLQFCDIDEIWPFGRSALLEYRLFGDPLDEPLEDHRPVGHTPQRSIRDPQVVMHQVHLRQAPAALESRKYDLVGVGDGHRLTVDLQLERSGHRSMLGSEPTCDPRHILWVHAQAN
jgi:hypothetical protein